MPDIELSTEGNQLELETVDPNGTGSLIMQRLYCQGLGKESQTAYPKLETTKKKGVHYCIVNPLILYTALIWSAKNFALIYSPDEEYLCYFKFIVHSSTQIIYLLLYREISI